MKVGSKDLHLFANFLKGIADAELGFPFRAEYIRVSNFAPSIAPVVIASHYGGNIRVWYTSIYHTPK